MPLHHQAPPSVFSQVAVTAGWVPNPSLATRVELLPYVPPWHQWVRQPLGNSGRNLAAVEKPPEHRHFNVRENQCAMCLFYGVSAAVRPLGLCSFAFAGSLLQMLLVVWHQLPCSR